VKPARRFLHVCYCCEDTVPVTKFFVEQLALCNTMSTPVKRSSGTVLGLEGDPLGGAAFVYDTRGPRTSPAIEIQSWIDPALLGTPVADPTAAGLQALGFVVPDVAVVTEWLEEQGCTLAGSGISPFGSPWRTLRDPRGVSLDLVEDPLMDAPTRMGHLRITCTDLEASLPWYHGLGFETVAAADISDGSFLGVSGSVGASVVRLRLPDEPFEALLIAWETPRSHGRHVAEPNHAGLYRSALGVDDTLAAYAAMSAAGWTFDRPPMCVELTGTPVPDMWICFLSDPDGVPFEFVGRPRSAFK
jgi:catechol 2,3-dioxygenase-like lactoylglutathione lyase family enzyme